jgi:hypothetical protein
MSILVYSHVYRRVSKELIDSGWLIDNNNSELFHHPDYGTHQIFKAILIQREATLKYNRHLFKKILSICIMVVILSYAIEGILHFLGVI